ncbi:Ycf66 family protein [Prochlorococcus marinus]|uniref:Ycf66 family protein n=1 Tax=Prochlorococcus marinus TaxID=1219 RepID=UPI0022B4A4E4|nr:Ycf66 family protein [Prochlorococcus marinus]
MVNASLNWASIVGIVLAVCGAGLYFLRSFKPALARDYDVFFAAIGLLCGGILFFQGWRLDPILQFGQFLLAGTTVFFAYESVRLRGIATDQARRSSYFDDEPELPRSSRGGLSDAGSDRNYDRFEESQPINRRFSGREDYQEEYADDENYGRRPSRAVIPEQAVSRRPRNISSSEINTRRAETESRMGRFDNSESSSVRGSSFGDRRTSRQETRRGSRPSASGQNSSRRRNVAPNSSQESSSRLNSDNQTSNYNASRRSSKTNNSIEDAAFSSSEKGVRRVSRRPAQNSDATPTKERPSSKSSYSSSKRKSSRPRDNSSRFDD